MKSIIRDVYDGRMRPIGEYHINTKRYKAAIEAESEAREKLLAAFPDCEELLKALEHEHLTIVDETGFIQFLIGFRFGAQLMSEMSEPIE